MSKKKDYQKSILTITSLMVLTILFFNPITTFAEIDQNSLPMTLDWKIKDTSDGTNGQLQDGDKVLVYGTINTGYKSTFEIDKIQTDVSLVLSDPMRERIDLEQVESVCAYDQCYFEWSITVGGPLWKHTGQYEIQACYFGYNNSQGQCASVEISYVHGDDNVDELMITIIDSVIMDKTQIDLEFNKLHVNYEITVTQDDKTILQETAHSMEMTASHMINSVASYDSPIVIKIVSFGVGLPGDNQNWSGPVGIVAIKQIVSEFKTITVWADKDTYYSGDIITLSGYVQLLTDDTLDIQIRKVDYNEFPTVLSFIKKPDMNGEYRVTFSVIDLGNSGNYNVKVVYGNNPLNAQTAFEFKTRIINSDNIPPLILTPSNVSTETVNPQGVVVTYSVKAIDDVDGVVNVSCRPFSGTTFPLGETRMTQEILQQSHFW